MTTTAGVKGKKDRRGPSRWKRRQGRPRLAFISTLDGISSALTIELGWKRSAFCFSLSFQPWLEGFAFVFFAHDQELAILLKPLPVVSSTIYSVMLATMVSRANSHPAHF